MIKCVDIVVLEICKMCHQLNRMTLHNVNKMQMQNSANVKFSMAREAPHYISYKNHLLLFVFNRCLE